MGFWFGEVTLPGDQNLRGGLEVTTTSTLIFILDCVIIGHVISRYLWMAEDLLIWHSALVNLLIPWRVRDISSSIWYPELQKKTYKQLNPIHNGKMHQTGKNLNLILLSWEKTFSSSITSTARNGMEKWPRSYTVGSNVNGITFLERNLTVFFPTSCSLFLWFIHSFPFILHIKLS